MAAGLGLHEAGQQVTDREPILALHGLVIVEGATVVAPRLVEAARPEPVVLVAD